MFTIKRSIFIALFLLSLPLTGYAADNDESLLVFAAASLRDALGAVVDHYEENHEAEVVVSYASSSTLARQIAQGAQADVYISANQKWMDYLAEENAIDTASRRDLLGNALVLVTHKDNPLEAKIEPGFDLSGLLGGSYLAMGNPKHVPAGIYGKTALESLGVWSTVADHIARAENVRAALALVARREAPLGIVYRSDALADDEVRVVDTFPTGSHAPIIYPVARVSSGNHPAAADFIEFLQTAQAADLFRQYGFDVLK